MSQKIFIIGAGGMVGAVCAYNMLVEEIVQQIILIDIDQDKLQGQAMDLFHAAAYTQNTRIKSGDYSQIEDDDIVIITAGVAQKPGQTRLDLAGINSNIIKDIISKIKRINKNIFIVIVTNPVDVLTYIALKESGLSKNRVFGSGTCTDTARLKAYLSEMYNVEHQQVKGMVLGEHGESCFVPLSQIRIKEEIITLDPHSLHEYLRTAAGKIIQKKGATYFGIGSVVGSIVNAIVNNTNEVMPVCSLVESAYNLNNTVVGLPHVINKDGARIIEDYKFTELELDSLKNSANIVNDYIAKVS